MRAEAEAEILQAQQELKQKKAQLSKEHLWQMEVQQSQKCTAEVEQGRTTKRQHKMEDHHVKEQDRLAKELAEERQRIMEDRHAKEQDHLANAVVLILALPQAYSFIDFLKPSTGHTSSLLVSFHQQLKAAPGQTSSLLEGLEQSCERKV
ncbi:hypothetical protein B0T25DRAFT_513936 [Lasiosphaeria hispida]|uniref:Uncharacterized protein n=1 Tax=Lasiosphaeria hispida TaxID=260671 RepID=A0AAJ0HWT8_9PEZI|nr:hypothetical protein B0T25DRAFT_513936 [Lasiosphaeria hispida]